MRFASPPALIRRLMSRPILATIDLPALRRNLARVRDLAGPSRVFAVVKADAYGHGLRRVLPALTCADGLALLDFADAERARSAGFGGRILLLEGAFDRDDWLTAARLGLDLVVHCDEQLAALDALPAGVQLGVFLKLNSGMNRLGFREAAFRRARDRVEGHRAVASLTLMTHFAGADESLGVEEQRACFARAAEGFRGEISLANSAALVAHPDTRGDWVRPGIVLYGATPFADRSAASLGFAPVMTLASHIIAVQPVEAGEHVGYGLGFTADRAMRVGVVACGYADGYPRHAPTGTPVLVDGVLTRTVGRVSMDMITVDLTPCPAAGVGAPVELWGARLPVDEVAVRAGTVGYELLCALAPRVPVVVSDDPGAGSARG